MGEFNRVKLSLLKLLLFGQVSHVHCILILEAAYCVVWLMLFILSHIFLVFLVLRHDSIYYMSEMS
jgi:hypothetical protein